jgi:CubicO group peptidase (beta-lactamase class C family)
MAAGGEAAVAQMTARCGAGTLRGAAIVAGVSIAVVAAAAPPFPRATPDSVGLSAAKLSDAKALLQQYVDRHTIAGAVAAVARRGKLAWIATAGVQDLAARTAMREDSIFRIYSMSKSVTAVAAMILHEQGRFSLDDPVARYLPPFDEVRVGGSGAAAPRKPSRPITVRDLLLHTSGLEHRTSDLYRRARVRARDITLPQFVANIVRVPLMEDPGTRFRYSEGTTVLGRLIEIWSGQPLDRFLEERIFAPLGMTDTGFWVPVDHRPRLTTVYAPADGGLKPIEIEEVPFTDRPALLEGAVGLVSTVPDYLRFAQMLLDKGQLGGVTILRADTVEAMTRNGLSDAVLAARGGTMGWGLANVNVALDGGEYGWDGTAGTIFWNDPAREMVTVLMTQSVPANPDGLRQRFKALIAQSVE